MVLNVLILNISAFAQQSTLVPQSSDSSGSCDTENEEAYIKSHFESSFLMIQFICKSII